MPERKKFQSYLQNLADGKFHVRVLLDWHGNEQYSETVDGVLIDMDADNLILEREIIDFEREKYGGVHFVHVTIPLTRVVQVIWFFSTIEE